MAADDLAKEVRFAVERRFVEVEETGNEETE
jgi:hypothetical protein